jgi:hypothetical protein
VRYLLLVAVAFLALGCTAEPPHERANAGANQSHDSRVVDGDEPLADDVVGKCFGIANTFSGKLSEEQERMVPEALRGAFTIESLQKITASDLAKELEFKTQVAEETHEGKRYVALKDFRHVVFSDEVSGMMIVIERYLVTSD